MQPHLTRALEGVALLVSYILFRVGFVREALRRAGIGRKKTRL